MKATLSRATKNKSAASFETAQVVRFLVWLIALWLFEFARR